MQRANGMHYVHHFLQGVWASAEFGICRGSTPNPLVGSEKQLQFWGSQKVYMDFQWCVVGEGVSWPPNIFQGSTIHFLLQKKYLFILKNNQ